MSAPTAWDGYTGKGTTIGVVDTGFAPHPDLSSKVVGGHDFISTTNLSNDGDGRDANAVDSGTCSTRYGQCYGGSAQSSSSWHGTHAAGTAGAARNNGGVAGIAPDATLLNARALGACGYGHESDIDDAVTWLAG